MPEQKFYITIDIGIVLKLSYLSCKVITDVIPS